MTYYCTGDRHADTWTDGFTLVLYRSSKVTTVTTLEISGKLFTVERQPACWKQRFERYLKKTELEKKRNERTTTK